MDGEQDLQAADARMGRQDMVEPAEIIEAPSGCPAAASPAMARFKAASTPSTASGRLPCSIFMGRANSYTDQYPRFRYFFIAPLV